MDGKETPKTDSEDYDDIHAMYAEMKSEERNNEERNLLGKHSKARSNPFPKKKRRKK